MEFNVSWESLLIGCEFKLVEFTTSFDCDHALTSFLLSQPAIERYFHWGYTAVHTLPSGTPLRSILPHLTYFHGNIMDLNIVVPHRPVTHVAIEEVCRVALLPSCVSSLFSLYCRQSRR